MKSNNRNLIFLILLISIVFSNFAYTSNIIYKKTIEVGPGVLNVDLTLPQVQNNVNLDQLTIPIIATKSEIYSHDGKLYTKGESKGSFSLSGYCACTLCGTGTGITASGKPVRANHTISADRKVLPFGTVIILENAVGKDGQVYDGVYVVEDTGGGVKNNHIDIYRPTHELASLVTSAGGLHGDVYIAKEYNIATLSNIGYN